jgi:hypothetical protein
MNGDFLHRPRARRAGAAYVIAAFVGGLGSGCSSEADPKPAAVVAECGPCAWPFMNAVFGGANETNTLVRDQRSATGCSFKKKEPLGELNVSFRCDPLEVCAEGAAGLECTALSTVVNQGQTTYTRGDWEFWECVGCE